MIGRPNFSVFLVEKEKTPKSKRKKHRIERKKTYHRLGEERIDVGEHPEANGDHKSLKNDIRTCLRGRTIEELEMWRTVRVDI